ncbi:MAG TPA: hypothetical protein DCS15_01185 [Flavobacteriales bacterium]|nr:hypothetical protein [Flavobacteriales bacterium]
MTKSLLISLLFSLLLGDLFSQRVFRSVGNGNWDDASTWDASAGTGGIEGITFPSPTDSVYIEAGDTVLLDLTNVGNNYEFGGFLYVGTNAVFQSASGNGNTDGLVLVDDSYVVVDGDFWVAENGEGPGTAGPAPLDFDIENNSYFRVNTGGYVYLADDWFIRDNAFMYVQINICMEVDDDLQVEDNAFICGAGGASIT